MNESGIITLCLCRFESDASCFFEVGPRLLQRFFQVSQIAFAARNHMQSRTVALWVGVNHPGFL